MKRMGWLTVFAGLLWGLACDGSDGLPEPYPAQIPLRDGKTLAADVFLPARIGSFPAILILTPYNRKGLVAPAPGMDFKTELPDRDRYAYVVADWRGFYGSAAAAEIAKEPLKQVGRDGYDAVEWIVAEDWSDGKVGMLGAGAAGMAAFATAVHKPPHLVCIVPVAARYVENYEQHYHGGVFKRESALARERAGLGGTTEILTAHPLRDAWWEIVEWSRLRDFPELDVPILMIGGWYDPETEGLLATFREIQEKADVQAREGTKVVIGPWSRGGAVHGEAQVGELAFPAAAGVSAKEMQRFFDYWLRARRNNRWDEEPAVRYYEMPGDAWRQSATWPPTPRQEKVFYLAPERTLTEELPPQGGQESFTYDPKDPSPTVGGAGARLSVGSEGPMAGPRDQRSNVESREDVVAYTSDALDTGATLVGAARMDLYVSSDRPDTDFIARLCDVHPDGRSMLVTEGARRLRFREGTSREAPATEREVVEVPLDLTVTAHRFLPGHRIRLLVSSSNYPRFDLNPNNGDAFMGEAEAPVARNRVYCGPERPSALILPTLAADDGTERASSLPRYDETGPFEVATLAFRDLRDNSRHGRRVPVKAHYPRSPGRFPLVIFSHGGAGNWDSNILQAQHLAGYGYVVLCTEHMYSNSTRILYYMRRRAEPMTLTGALGKITTDPNAVLGRPADVSFVIDRAVEWDRGDGALSGKIDTDRVAVIGHSFGAYTALVMCGARPILDHLDPSVPPGKGLAPDLSDPRVTIGIALSPQGTGGPFFGKESFKTIDRPMLLVSGTRDVQKGVRGVLPAERRREAFGLMPAGEKYLLWLTGADHLGFSDKGKPRRQPQSAVHADMQRIAKAMTVVFCDAMLKGDEVAKAHLDEDYANTLCGQGISRVTWKQK